MVRNMGVQQTSLRAYREIQPELITRQAIVYNLLFEATSQGMNMTNMEIARALHWSINRVTPRVYELRQMGAVRLDCKRKCGVTGRLAMGWKTT